MLSLKLLLKFQEVKISPVQLVILTVIDSNSRINLHELSLCLELKTMSYDAIRTARSTLLRKGLIDFDGRVRTIQSSYSTTSTGKSVLDLFNGEDCSESDFCKKCGEQLTI